MTAWRWRHRAALMLLAWLICQAANVSTQDALARAKDLYLSADYDQALDLLNHLQAESQPDAVTEVAQYRLFCLLALNRGEDAQAAIVGIVSADPFYRPSETLTSPRIRAVFQNTRKALLPSVVQRSYEEAKVLFEKKDPRAVVQFEKVLALIDDPDLKGMAQLSDLRTVVSGFRDLSKVLAAPLPATTGAATAPLPIAVVPQTAASSGPVRTAPPLVTPQNPPASPKAPRPETEPATRTQETGVTPPVVVSQPLPRWAPSKSVDARVGFKGSISVMIDERGNVTSATLRQSVHPLYDDELLKLAKTWKYKPATRNGVPMSYLKIVEIQLQPVR